MVLEKLAFRFFGIDDISLELTGLFPQDQGQIQSFRQRQFQIRQDLDSSQANVYGFRHFTGPVDLVDERRRGVEPLESSSLLDQFFLVLADQGLFAEMAGFFPEIHADLILRRGGIFFLLTEGSCVFPLGFGQSLIGLVGQPFEIHLGESFESLRVFRREVGEAEAHGQVVPWLVFLELEVMLLDGLPYSLGDPAGLFHVLDA